MIPQSDVNIELVSEVIGGTGGNSGKIRFKGWIMTDPSGMRYHFGATETGMNWADYVETNASSSSEFFDVHSTVEVISSWYLSKIESSDRKDVINFNYTTEQYAFWTPGGESYVGGAEQCPPANIDAISPIKTKVTGKRLTTITSTNAFVTDVGFTINSGSGISNRTEYYMLANLGNATIQAGVTYRFQFCITGAEGATYSGGSGKYYLYRFTRPDVYSNKMAGGLRIKTIITADGMTANDRTQEFIYSKTTNSMQSSGEVLFTPVYAAYILQSAAVATNLNFNTGVISYVCGYAQWPLCSSSGKPGVVYSSSTLQPMQTTQGSHIAYRNVSVRETGKGTTVYTYSLKGAIPPYVYDYNYNGIPPSPLPDYYYIYPFSPPRYSPMLGTLSKEEVRSDDGVKVHEKTYTYITDSLKIFPSLKPLKMRRFALPSGCHQHPFIPGNSQEQAFDIYPYVYLEYYTGVALTSSITERKYDADGTTYQETINSFTYALSNGHFQKITEETTNSDGNSYITKYKYAKDYPCPSGINCDENNGINAEAKAM